MTAGTLRVPYAEWPVDDGRALLRASREQAQIVHERAIASAVIIRRLSGAGEDELQHVMSVLGLDGAA